jgi:type II secretory pathway component PulC
MLGAAIAAHWVAQGIGYWLGGTAAHTPHEAATIDPAAIARALGATDRANAGTTSTVATDITVKGVVAADGTRPASAVVNTGGRDQVVFVGGEILPGAKLAAVRPNAIVVHRATGEQEILLDFSRSARRNSPGAAPIASQMGAAPARVNFPLEVAASGTQYTFSRKRLDESLKDPATLTAVGRIGAAPGGGARVEDAPGGSLAARLGLQPGDIIRSINGQSVAGPGDLARLYQQFPTLNRIEAEVQRGAGTVKLAYTVAP